MKEASKNEIINESDMEEGVVYFGILPDGYLQAKGKMHGIVVARNLGIGFPKWTIKAVMNSMFIIEKYGIEKMREIWDKKCTDWSDIPQKYSYKTKEVIWNKSISPEIKNLSNFLRARFSQ